MALVEVQGVRPPGPGDAHATRRALRAERAQLAHWRRLLRARLDLAVGALAPPEPLGTLSWDLVPGVEGLLPSAADLADAVATDQPDDVVDLMTRLRRLDRALGRYAARLDEALESTTDELVLGLAGVLDDDAPTDPDGR
ncbi:hypothetical protein Q9R32_13410 [Actinotalea sp. AC32]|nr:hypothetical protein [Actinotalea sp. AC32]